ncbi:glycosyltransferase [Streptomonospora sediminis]
MRSETDTGPHILFLPYPSPGHVTPTLPVAGELLRRGHRVTYAVTEAVADAPARIGASVIDYDTALMSTTDPPDEWTGDELGRALVQYISEITGTTAGIENRLATDRPDCIVYDSTVWAPGRVLGRKWGLPTCRLLPVFASNDTYNLMQEQVERADHPQLSEDDPAARTVRDLMGDFLARHGIDPAETDEIAAGKGEPALVFLPRSFQPFGDTFGDDHAFVGPCFGAESGSGGWSPPGNGRPVAFVSLGTVVNDHPEFFRTCADAFDGLPWHVVVATGGHDPGPLPANFEVHDWVPYAEVLRHADVFVSQAGMGSIMRAGYHVTPLVVVPFQPEQRVNADRVAELGLGRRIDPAAATADSLREAVLAAAGDTATRTRLRNLRADIDAAGGAPRAADFVEERMGRRAGSKP